MNLSETFELEFLVIRTVPNNKEETRSSCTSYDAAVTETGKVGEGKTIFLCHKIHRYLLRSGTGLRSDVTDISQL